MSEQSFRENQAGPAASGRRHFLALAACAGAGLTGASLASGATGCAATWADPRTARHSALRQDCLRRAAPSAADWAALARELSGHRLVRPGQRDYRQARELYDPRFDYLAPRGVAYCRTPADIAACLAFAARYRLPVRARCGGHSYGGWSSVTGGLVADITGMRSFHASGRLVRAGAGNDLIGFYSRLAAAGLAVPGGSCPTVGLAGLTLGGGVGVVARRYGLTCDALEAVQMVMADGAVLHCDASRNADLFWACRGGGGGNFGVATAFTFRAHELPSLVLFSASWPWSATARLVDAWQRWAPHAPDGLWSTLHLIGQPGGGAPRLTMAGTWTGSVAGARAQLSELYQRAGSAPSGDFVRPMPYLDAMLVEAGCGEIPLARCRTGRGGRLARVPSYAKSDFFTRTLSRDAIATMVAGIERVTRIAGAPGGVGAIALDALGGAINRVHPDATAFVHRNGLFLAQYSTSWTFPGPADAVGRQHSWLRSLYAGLHPHASGQAYQNYADPELADWRQAYYGANYARLAQVKARYDPHGLFRFPQAITPA
jgi:FAD/FMN-containing dehydrogenase